MDGKKRNFFTEIETNWREGTFVSNCSLPHLTNSPSSPTLRRRRILVLHCFETRIGEPLAPAESSFCP